MRDQINYIKNIALKVKENKVAISLRNNSSDTILFRLVNIKRSNTKSYNIFEKVKYSTNLKNAFENNYRSIDYTYDTLSNNRLKNVNLLSKKALRSNLKDKYLELINSNSKFINNVWSKYISSKSGPISI